MKPSTENEIAGKVHEVKGAIKEKVGQLTNDPDLEGAGTGEKIDGKVQKKIGQVRKCSGNRFFPMQRDGRWAAVDRACRSSI